MPVYEIADYDPAWPHAFEAESARLLAEIGPYVVAVEHVGSTAVPGLAAKPIVDLLAGIRSLAEAPRCIERLAHLGYAYVPEYEAIFPYRRYFRRRPAEGQRFNLHMVEPTTWFWERMLLFRDWLRTHPDDARGYEALKRRLANEVTSAADYREAKTPFIREIEKRAALERRASSR